jgi:hypothetical protein
MPQHKLTYGVNAKHGVSVYLSDSKKSKQYRRGTLWKRIKLWLDPDEVLALQSVINAQVGKAFNSYGMYRATLTCPKLLGWIPPFSWSCGVYNSSVETMKTANSWFCSELISAALVASHVLDVDQHPPCKITPVLLYQIIHQAHLAER